VTGSAPPGLETVSGEKIGRDPRLMSAAELQALNHTSSSVLAAVRAHCVDCCGGEAAEARKCVVTSCPLWPFRMGVNPLARRAVSAEQRAAMRERAAKARSLRGKPK
jgi:hypothetical protein